MIRCFLSSVLYNFYDIRAQPARFAAQTGQINAKYPWSVSSTIAMAKSTPSTNMSLQVPFKQWWEAKELTPANGPNYCRLPAAP